MDSSLPHALALALAQKTAPAPRPLADMSLLDAATMGDLNMVLQALDQGANPDARGSRRRSALMIVLARDFMPPDENVRRLVQALIPVSNLSAQDDDGATPLGVAASNQGAVGPWAVDELIKAGANPRERGRGGFDALSRACQRGRLESVQALLPLSDLTSHRKHPNPAHICNIRGLPQWAALIEAERERRQLALHAPASPRAASKPRL